MLRWDAVASDSAAKYILCSSTLPSIANPVIYHLVSLRYRLHYRRIFAVTSRLLFGCPVARYDSDNDDDASRVAINSGEENGKTGAVGAGINGFGRGLGTPLNRFAHPPPFPPLLRRPRFFMFASFVALAVNR